MKVEHFDWERFERIFFRKDEAGRVYVKQAEREDLAVTAASIIKFLKAHENIKSLNFDYHGLRMPVGRDTTQSDIVEIVGSADVVASAAREEIQYFLAQNYCKNMPHEFLNDNLYSTEHYEWQNEGGLYVRADENGRIYIKQAKFEAIEDTAKKVLAFLKSHPEILSAELEYNQNRMAVTNDTTLENITRVMNHETIIYGELNSQIRFMVEEYYRQKAEGAAQKN